MIPPQVETGSGLPPSAAADFYRESFPGRSLEQRWPWLYRTAFPGSPFPLLMRDGARTVAHAGGIPFVLCLGEREYRAAWFVDFVVTPGLQRRGLGSRLTRAWMDASEIGVTFCNDRSMAVFKRFEWIESFDTSLHTLWIRPFDHRRAAVLGAAARTAGNRLAAPIWHGLLGRYASGDPRLEPLAPGAGRAFVEAGGGPPGDDVAVPVRDAEYWSWRVEDSPERDRYRLYREGDVTFLIKLRDDSRRSIDVLWISEWGVAAHETIRAMLASLARWALRHQYSSVRYYPPARVLSDRLSSLRPVVSRPRFAYWAADATLLQRLRSVSWQWQLLDSDFEWL
jgi:hypothetical protein